MGGVRGNPAITHDGDYWSIPPGETATWFGIPIPAGVTTLQQDVFFSARHGEAIWLCTWVKDSQSGYIEQSTEVPIQERIQAAIVAMRMQHGNDSETEGGSPP